ncbi:MAG: GST-like protein [Sphingomonas bacterium]|nr:GST-like protein [Sphingomonas bacterium]
MLPVSLTFAGALALLNVWLGIRVTQVRVGGKILIGDGGHPRLLARMRAHANFIEYTPFMLILLALIEIAGAPRAWLWGIGILYVIARIAHAYGMERTTTNPFRAGGAIVTWLVLIGLGLWAIVLASHVPAVGAVHYL